MRFKGALNDNARGDYDLEWGHSDPSYFTPSELHGVPPSEPERVLIGHGTLSEDVAGDTFDLKDSAQDYYGDFHRFPAGDNRSIVRQLAGLNPKKKTYKLLGGNFDRDGNIVDLWNEPYVFDFRRKREPVYSRRYKQDLADQKNGRLPPDRYDPTYHQTKEDIARGACYELALAVRVVVERQASAPSAQEAIRAVYAPYHLTPKAVQNLLVDPWGSPYVIRLTPTQVTSSSVHLPNAVATEPLNEPMR